jgi:heme A synthase
MTALQRLSVAALVAVFVLVVVGVTVRATNSGLGCPEWPRCNGSFIPQWDKHTLIEYSHRLTATVTGFIVLALAITAWRGYRRVPAVLYPATAALILVAAQAALGGATVLHELPPELVALHLGVAMTFAALLLVTATAAFATTREIRPVRVSTTLGRATAVTAVLLFAVMIVGSYMAGADYSLACSGWPLCNGQVIPTTHAVSVEVHFLHRLLAFTLGLAFAATAFLAWREKDSEPMVMRLMAAAFVLFLVQALIGAANIWTKAADVVQIAHLATGTLLWLTFFYLNLRIHSLHALLPSTPVARVRRGNLARAAR